MQDNNKTLKELFSSDLSIGFLKDFRNSFQGVYAESYTSLHNNPALDTEQANYTMGYLRRGLAETKFKRLADKHGLEAEVTQPDKGGPKYVRVSIGRFGLTMSHVASAGKFPKHSDSREQSSKINYHASQGELFSVSSEPEKEELYGVFVHNEIAGDKSSFGSLHIGFPNPKFTDWIDAPIDIQDLIDAHDRASLSSDVDQGIQPKFKKNILQPDEKDQESK